MTTWVKDWLGNTVRVDDQIIAVFSKDEMRLARVVGFGEKQNSQQHRHASPKSRITMKCEWLKSLSSFVLNNKNTDIYVDLNRFVRVS